MEEDAIFVTGTRVAWTGDWTLTSEAVPGMLVPAWVFRSIGLLNPWVLSINAPL